MSNDQKPDAKRYIGKVKELDGAYGKFQKIWIDNPDPKKKDGTADPYYKGQLLWYDAATNKWYVVRSIAMKGITDEMKARGITNTLMIDLEDKFSATESGS